MTGVITDLRVVMTGVIAANVFRRFYAHAWGKRLTCPELKYKCCGELWYATRTRAAGHLRHGAILDRCDLV